jgi:fermentation-respiration switch protein FrsA (DUF1100 family)
MAALRSHSTHRTATGKNYLLSAVRVLLLLAVGLYLFTQYVRRTTMFVPARFPEGPWDGLGGEDVWFKSTDGVRLHGRLFRANGPLLLYCHGNAGNLSDRGFIAAELARRGIAVLLFDWRGYGKSEGHPTESALFRDALGAYDFAKSINPDIAVYGESLGGPYAAYIATQRHVRCVIIENSFPSLAAMGNYMYKPIPLGWFAPLALRTQHWLNDAGKPVLVMHGKRDAVIPFELGMQLYEGLRVPKELVVSESAGHCEMANVERDRYYATIVKFLGAHHGHVENAPVS